MRSLKRLLAVTLLSVVYSFAWLVSVLAKRMARSKIQQNRITVIGTFHNPNWFFAHVEPLVKSGYGEVLLICDEPIADMSGLTYLCPPSWLSGIFSRAGAKLVLAIIQGFCKPSDVYIGYHIFPAAIIALVCSRIYGAKCVFQVTSGQLELEGGGWNAENRVMVALGAPSTLVERLALRVTRQFDLVVVRGSRAEKYLRSQRCQMPVQIVTGSVSTDSPIPETKDIDVVFIGRLAEYKRPDLVVEILCEVAGVRPHLSALIIGDGPMRSTLEEVVIGLGYETNIHFLGQRDDVSSLVSRARVFILASRWEGVSIAMLEAMAMKAVPVVSDVGDLRDFVENDVSGFIIPDDADAIDAFVERIVMLLEIESERERIAHEARRLVVSRCERNHLSKRWGAIISGLAISR